MADEIVLLLTEVVDSTRLWEADDEAMAAATTRLDGLVAAIVADHGGEVVKPRGEGDAHFLVFADPVRATDAAAAIVTAVADEPLLAVRASCHVGPAEQRGGDWYGTTVNRCARLRGVAHGRQILVSAAVAARLPEERTRSVGHHRLKDLDEPVEIFQIVGPGLPSSFPPLATLQQDRDVELPLDSFVGRDEVLARTVHALAAGESVTLVGPPGVGKRRLALEARRALLERGPAAAAPEPAEAYAPTGRSGEVVIPVAPLVPSAARQLFLDRLEDPVDGDVDGLVALLDGLPLAIELAARRAATMPVARLIQRLSDDPLAVLGGDRSAGRPHHASLRAALAHCDGSLDQRTRDQLRAASPPSWAHGWFRDGRPLPLLRSLLS